jgi:type IV pilus assembly protein PilA
MNRKTLPADCHRARRTVAPNGFTLMELLIVIAVILILMLMAMKSIGSMKIRANEVSAINSLRVITQAEIEYDSTYPANGYACDLKALGGVPGSGMPTPTGAQLLDNDLASSGFKSGYYFKISNCEKVTVNGTDRITGYVLTAVPAAPGKTGNRGFCTDQFGGAPKYDPAGGTSCTQSLQ